MSGPPRGRGPSRHELPEIDAAALAAARGADRLLVAAHEAHIGRWERYLAPLPDLLRDGDLRELRAAARSGRAAFGTKDSIADALPSELTAAFREEIDALLRRLARFEAERRG